MRIWKLSMEQLVGFLINSERCRSGDYSTNGRGLGNPPTLTHTHARTHTHTPKELLYKGDKRAVSRGFDSRINCTMQCLTFASHVPLHFSEKRSFLLFIQTHWRGRVLEEAGNASLQAPFVGRWMHKAFQSLGLLNLAFYPSSKFPKLTNKYFSAYLYFVPKYEAHCWQRICKCFWRPSSALNL